jgi:hypothetical protein
LTFSLFLDLPVTGSRGSAFFYTAAYGAVPQSISGQQRSAVLSLVASVVVVYLAAALIALVVEGSKIHLVVRGKLDSNVAQRDLLE